MPLTKRSLSAEESVLRLIAMVDSAEDAILSTELDGTITTWNAAACQLFGYRSDEIVGDSVLLLIPPLAHHEHTENMRRLQAGERIEHQETQRLRKGGTRIDVSLTISAVRDHAGNIVGAAMIARDMTVRRREEAARSRLAAIVESSDDAIVAKDLNGVVTDWNAAAERLFGYTPEEMIGRSILTIIPPELQHEEPMILGKIRAGHRIEHYETERLHKSGLRLQVSVSTSPIRDSSGRVIGASKIARDISERRRLENARRILAAIVESSDDAIISKNLDGIIISWNEAAERVLGYKAEEIIGQSVLRIIPAELHHEEPGIISRLRDGQRIEHFETRRRRKNGDIFPASLTVSPIRNEAGEVIGGSKILRDISDRKAAEAALLEKERLAAAGRLAATLAHEVNNPLESITNLAYLLSQHQGLDGEASGYADTLLKEVQRAGDITRQTLGYYRESKIPVPVSLREIVDHVVVSKRKKIDDKKLNVGMQFTSAAMVQGRPGELRQVLDNVIQNAVDAVPFGGHICVRTADSPDGRVRLEICDDGPGIPRDVLTRLFDPFFTTKSDKGSGLGLWVSRAIMVKHGGSVTVHTDPQAQQWRTVFQLELPAPAARAQAPAGRLAEAS